MNTQGKVLAYIVLISVVVLGKLRKPKPWQKINTEVGKGTQCYNCLSYDHPGCWDPDHPDHANITVPNIDCYIHGMSFVCIVITAESAKLVSTGDVIGPVRARTCVPAKDFSKKTISYSMCSKLATELSASEIFTQVNVNRPRCTLCKTHLCTDASRC